MFAFYFLSGFRDSRTMKKGMRGRERERGGKMTEKRENETNGEREREREREGNVTQK